MKIMVEIVETFTYEIDLPDDADVTQIREKVAKAPTIYATHDMVRAVGEANGKYDGSKFVEFKGSAACLILVEDQS